MNGILSIYKNPPLVPSTVVVATPYNYGNLYNWYAVNSGKLAPTNYRVPTLADFQTLSTYLGGNSVSGGKLKSTRTAPISHPRWEAPNTDATNTVNYEDLPNGYRDGAGSFADMGVLGITWASTESSPTYANRIYTSSGSAALTFNTFLKTNGYGVTFLRDATVAEQLLDDGVYVDDVVDYDNNWYKTVKIGTQIWSNQNLKTTSYNDGVAIPKVQDGTAWGALSTGAYCTYDNAPLSDNEDPTYYYNANTIVMIPDKDTRQDWNYRRHGFNASYGAIYTPTLKLHKFFFNTLKAITVSEFKARKVNTCDPRQKVIADEISLDTNLLNLNTNTHDLQWYFLAAANLTGLTEGYWEYYIKFSDESSYISELMYVPSINEIDETAPDFNNDFSLDFNA